MKIPKTLFTGKKGKGIGENPAKNVSRYITKNLLNERNVSKTIRDISKLKRARKPKKEEGQIKKKRDTL